MTVRINANSCKNALGTVFLLATAFFVCSTFISMRSVFADPIVSANTSVQSGRQSPRSTSRSTSKRTVSRSTVSRATATPTRTATSRGTAANKTVASRAAVATRSPAATRGNVSRVNSRTTQNANKAVRARSASTTRVGVGSNVMSAGRAGTSNQKATNAYLNSVLNNGYYSNIVDSTTGLISADAYSNCMQSYYACMDEICTTRSTAKGRCSCAGRATNFMTAEEALEKANEELIVLSGQLALLVATKGKGDDLAAAFSLTEAEQVMNCVSWREAKAKCAAVGGSGDDCDDYNHWYSNHPTFASADENATVMTDSNKETMPYYCNKNNNNFGFDISSINGSSSEILAQLKSWAEAKDEADTFNTTDVTSWFYGITNLAEMVDAFAGVRTTIDTEAVNKDKLSKKWGCQLFEYAHNNVCGRVLDSCFNGIYEACGTPPTVTESDGFEVNATDGSTQTKTKTTHIKCQNGQSAPCPFNYNSYIGINAETGDVQLNENNGTSDTLATSNWATCFGYSVDTTSTSYRSGTRTYNDPYYSLRGPVADARRSIMQKYLLDSNAACDAYGENIKKVAQNINYQKVAAQQALQQKRLEFRQQEENSTVENYKTYADNFVNCLSDIYDCYTETADEGWTTARIKTYCAQKSQVQSCYLPMVCSPSHLGLQAVIDKPDNPDSDNKCSFTQDFRENTCRNVVTISEILYGANTNKQELSNYDKLKYGNKVDSQQLRESCLREAGVAAIRNWRKGDNNVYECTRAEIQAKDSNASNGYKTTEDGEECEYITDCNDGYIVANNKCYQTTRKCTDAELLALLGNDADKVALVTDSLVTLDYDTWTYNGCVILDCKTNYHVESNECKSNTKSCSANEINDAEAQSGTKTWNKNTNKWGDCEFVCGAGKTFDENTKKCKAIE